MQCQFSLLNFNVQQSRGSAAGTTVWLKSCTGYTHGCSWFDCVQREDSSSCYPREKRHKLVHSISWSSLFFIQIICILISLMLLIKAPQQRPLTASPPPLKFKTVTAYTVCNAYNGFHCYWKEPDSPTPDSAVWGGWWWSRPERKTSPIPEALLTFLISIPVLSYEESYRAEEPRPSPGLQTATKTLACYFCKG